MAVAIGLMNEKGGVGKSTLTYSCAWKLAEMGRKVLIIDMDGQGANVSHISGVTRKESTPTMFDVLIKGRKIQETVVRCNIEGLYIIPATQAVSDAMTSAKLSKMKRAVGELKAEYDYIFVDVNPSPDWRHALALSVLDYVCIVMLPDVMSLEANLGMADSVLEIQENVNPMLKVAGIVFNQRDTRTNMGKSVSAQAEKFAFNLGTKVLKSSVRKSVTLGESVLAHEGVTKYGRGSAVASDVEGLVAELVEVCR